ncbi:MAG: glycosyl transferase [Oscillospiraceae bacterium]|nr:glycosyl transferase [Oscillospiraceae bacterium]
MARLSRAGLLKWMPDKMYLKLRYYSLIHKKLDLKNPKTFNEKLQWMKLYNRKPEYTMMVDKYAVRDYIADQIGAEYLIPLLGAWERVEDIDFDGLPEQFVLKCNHDSASVVICKDKTEFNREAAKNKLAYCLKRNLYWWGREWPYKNVKPRIIAEKYMVDESGTELRDYKVMCFNGEPKLIQYHQGRFAEEHTQDFYDPQWNRQEFTQGLPLAETPEEKPVFLDEMLELSRKLSAGIPHVRVDWYYVQGQLYFGELTFFDASGFYEFEPAQWNEIVGSWITLPEKAK